MIYQFEDFLLDTRRRELRRAEEVRAVEPQVLALLELLIANSDRMVSKDEIVEEIWNGRVVSDGSINSRIKLLRKAIDDDGKQQRLIKTVHGQGFRFVGELAQTSDTAKGPQEENRSETPPSAATVSMAQDSAPTVAVLPFDSMSSDPEQDHLADGMCEDILTILSKIPGLNVIARNSSFTYKGKAVDIRKVGQELGASHVLEGSVRRSGDRLRVTGQLIVAADGTHLWAERYDRTLDDIFEIQDDMTRHIVSALQITLVEGQMAAYWAGGTKSFEAWRHQVRVLPLIRTLTAENILKARALSRQAVAIDPGYSEAWISIAVSLLGESLAGWGTDFQTNLPDVIDAYEKALENNAESPLAIAWSGVAEIYSGNHDTGLHRIEKAVALAPNSPQIGFGLFFAKIFCDDYDEPIYPQFMSVANGTPHFLTLSAVNCLVIGKPREALEFALWNIKAAPNYLWAHALAAAAHAAMDDQAEAENQVARLLAGNPGYTLSHFAGTLPFRTPARTDALVRLAKKAGLSEVGRAAETVS